MSSLTKKKRFTVITPAQHLLVHDIYGPAFTYTNLSTPPGSVTNIGEALDYVFKLLYPHPKASVATVADLPAVGNTLYDMRLVLDDGSSNVAMYRWEQREGDGSAKWYKVGATNWGFTDVVSFLADQTQDLYVMKLGSQERDYQGNILTGDLAGQHIYGGQVANQNLTLFANSGDGTGPHTGYIQFDDNVRPLANNSYALGMTGYVWSDVYATQAHVGNLTISSDGSKSYLVDSHSAIDMTGCALSSTSYSGNSITVGTLAITIGATPDRTIFTESKLIDLQGKLETSDYVKIDSDITIESGSIKSASGAISFDDENVSTTGSVTGGSLVADHITIDGDSITNGTTDATFAFVATGGSGKFTFNKPVEVTGNLSSTAEVSGLTGKLGLITHSTNIISTTADNNSINLSPHGTGKVQFSKNLAPDANGTLDFGNSANLVKDIYFSGNLVNATQTFTNSDLFVLRNNTYRDSGRSQAAQSGDVLVYNGTMWLAGSAATGVKHEDLSGLHGSAAIPSTNADAGHPQFALLAGRAGGQSIVGGTGASETLVLESTAHATKGLIKFKDDVAPNASAAYSGGWTGVDLGTTSLKFNDVYSNGEFKGFRLENLDTDPAASAQNIGRVFYNTSSGKIKYDTGTDIKVVGSGSGGAGSSLQFHIGSGDAPTEAIENDVKVFKFVTGGSEKIYAEFEVPEGYEAGSQITVVVPLLTSDNTNTNKFKFQLTATLIRHGTDAVTSTTNQSVVTSEKDVLSTANIPQKASFQISSNGTINSVAIGANLIKLELTRIAASSNDTTSDVCVLVGSTTITIGA